MSEEDFDMSGSNESWEDDMNDQDEFDVIEEDIIEDEGGHELRRNKSFEVLTADGVSECVV